MASSKQKDEFNDGICDSCGSPGLAGEHCPCGGIRVSLETDTIDPVIEGELSLNEPETYPLDAVDAEAGSANDEDL